MSLDFDICVVGAGMVGATAAALLAMENSHLKVAVVDKTLPTPLAERDPYELRVSAISRSSQRILAACNAWSQIQSFRHCPYQRMRVWDSSTRPNEGIEFDCAEIAEQDLGSIVENRIIQTALVQQLRTLSNIELVVPGTVDELLSEGHRQKIVLEDGR